MSMTNIQGSESKLLLVTKLAGVLLIVFGIGLMGFVVWTEYRAVEEQYYEAPVRADEPYQEPPQVLEPDVPQEDYYYPVGTLHRETPERQSYVTGDLQLYIPQLDLKTPVYNGVDDDTLMNGVGLFDEAQLPRSMDINSNTVIAGHRDIHGEEFYFIDEVEIGDYIYLTYEGDLYTYEIIDQFFTDAMDWSPVEVKEYPCITLQSCHPIGIATDRIFTVGRLIDITYDSDFPPEDAVHSRTEDAADDGFGDDGDTGDAPIEGELTLEPDGEPT